MALVASPAPPAPTPCDAKLPPFHSGKNQIDMWDSYEDNGGHHGDEEPNLESMGGGVPALDQQKQPEQHKFYQPASTSGLSRNASFDSVTSHDSCTASFSTGSPVTVLPPLPYTCGGTGMDISSSSISNHAVWTNNFNTNKRSAGLEHSEPQESIPEDGFWMNPDQMLLSEDCEQLLASPVGTLSSMLNEFPFARYEDQVCASNCNDYPSVNELECLVPSSHRTEQQQGVKSPESVGNNSGVHQQQDFCPDFLVGSEQLYTEHNAAQRRSESSLLSPPSARRRLSWSEYQVPNTAEQRQSTSESLQFAGFNPQAYDAHNHLQTLSTMSNKSCVSEVYANSYRSSTVGQDIINAGESLKRPYSAMMQQQPSTCSISSSPPAVSHNSYLKFTPSALVPAASAPKSSLSAVVTHNQQDAAAFSALLYKTQGTSEMIQQLQQAQGQGTSSSDSARQLPPPKLRRRHGTATDPQSIAARTRRERFSDRIRILQSLVPNGERLDTVSMLGHTLEYVRFLQHQVWQLYNDNDDGAVSADSESREKWKEFMDAQTVAT